jgi:hypothetical protein
MYQKSVRHLEYEKIESVNRCFFDRLSDLKPIKDRPEAAAALSLAFLIDLSSVLYSCEPAERVRRFVDNYLPAYRDIGIYDLFKNSLEYNHSLEKAAQEIDADYVTQIWEKERTQLFPKFVNDLEKAVRRLVEEIREEEEKWQLALRWRETHKVFQRPMSLYTDEQKNMIVGYYSRRFKSRSIFKEGYDFGFNFNPFQDNGSRINVCIRDRQVGKEVFQIPLEILIGLLRLKKIGEVIGEFAVKN